MLQVPPFLRGHLINAGLLSVSLLTAWGHNCEIEMETPGKRLMVSGQLKLTQFPSSSFKMQDVRDMGIKPLVLRSATKR